MCRSIGVLCYEPDDLDDPLLSLTWIETLQYIDDECLDDFECTENVLKSFGCTLDIVINYQYEFLLDLSSVAKKLEKHLDY